MDCHYACMQTPLLPEEKRGPGNAECQKIGDPVSRVSSVLLTLQKPRLVLLLVQMLQQFKHAKDTQKMIRIGRCWVLCATQ